LGPHVSIGSVVMGTVQPELQLPLGFCGSAWKLLHSGPGPHAPADVVQGVTSIISFCSMLRTCCEMLTYVELHVQSQLPFEPGPEVDPTVRQPQSLPFS